MSANSQVARNQSRQTFDSVYESTNPLTTLAGQRMVEWFTGNSLNTDRWTETDIAGAGTVAMSDSIDGGLSITTATGSSDMQGINFNDKRQYGSTPSVSGNSGCIGIVQKVATSTKIWCGLKNSGKVDSENWTALYGDGQDGTYKSLTTGGPTGQSTATSSVANDTAWTLFKIKTTPSFINLTINGVLEISKTDDINATVSWQPIFQVKAAATGGKEGKIRYMEAWQY